MCSEEENSRLINCDNNSRIDSYYDKENENFRFSQILFTDSENDSISLKFVMKPCIERRKVRQLIECGGGVMTKLTDCQSNKAINLVTTNANISHYNVSKHDYYYCNYIYDCCEANELLDLNNYRLKKTTTITMSSDVEDNEEIACHDTNEWHFDERDSQVLAYISRRKAFADICGHRLWTKALDDGVSYGQTWESTKERFFNHIMPNIDNYSIDDLLKEKFLKYYKFYNNNELTKTKKCNPINNSDSNDKHHSIPDIVITAPSLESSSQTNVQQINENNKNELISCVSQTVNNEKNIEKVMENSCENQILNKSNICVTNDDNKKSKRKNDGFECSDDIKELSQINKSSVSETQSKQLEIESKKKEKQFDTDLDETTDDSDLDFGDNSKTVQSKYFVNKNSKRLQNKVSEKGYLNAYLDFMKRREETTTPENLQRIKQALKVGKNDCLSSVSDQLTEPSTSKRSKSSTTFGGKIVEKINEHKSKQLTDSQENGHKVSDISTDDNSDNDINVVSEKVVKRKLCLYRNKNTSIRNKSISLYDLNEDENIIKYILKTKRFDELKGNSVWEEAYNKDICSGRSWQSMKERFRKYIMPNIDSYEFSKKDKTTLKNHFFAERDVEMNRSITGAYTHEEDHYILRFIINKNGFDSVKGNKFWHEMEEDMQRKLSSHRSWQSLKERYRKRIIPHLNKYRIKIELVKKILNGISIAWMSSSGKIELINKCKKALMNAKQMDFSLSEKPKKQKQIIHKESEPINDKYNSDTELEEEDQ